MSWWLLAGVAWLLLSPVLSIILLPLGGPFAVLAIGAVIAWGALEDLDGTETPEEEERNYWRVVLLLVVAVVTVLSGLYLVANGKSFAAAAKSTGAALNLAKLFA